MRFDRNDFYCWVSGGDGRRETVFRDVVVWWEVWTFKQQRVACACFTKEGSGDSKEGEGGERRTETHDIAGRRTSRYASSPKRLP